MVNRQNARRAKAKTKANANSSTPHKSFADTVDVDSITFAQAMAVLFEQHLHHTCGTSAHTVDSYKSTFRLFLRFLQEYRPELLQPHTALVCFDASLVQAFLRHLSELRDCCASTVNVRRAAFGSLAVALACRYPQLSAYCHSIAAIPGRKARDPLVGYFELNELDAIFGGIDTSRPDGFRDLVMLRCLYNTGARASELCRLQLGDLRLSEPAHVVLHGKGGKVRTAALWPVTVDLLRAYLKGARRTPKPGHDSFVFIGRRGNALTRQGLYKLARHHLDNAARKLPQLRRSELHPVCSFRHTTATHLLMAGVSLVEIQEILGHARHETTMRYRTVSLEHKRQALERLLAMRVDKHGLDGDSCAPTSPEWTGSQQAIDWLERL